MAAEKRPRIFQGGKDMALTIGVLVAVMLISVGFTGLCSFNPGAPESGPVQEVDAKTFTDMEARAVSFPLRYPEMPEDWVTNSARRSMLGGEPAPVIGWVTPDKGYLSMTQTGVELDKAVVEIDDDPREISRTESIGGAEVQVYSSKQDGVRDIWATDVGDARLLFTGAGTPEEFTQLIETAVKTAPIPTT
ncbi:DUF4245 domain-containing protein [Corynebacterium breve]|uniref:DUF4245 domain-containing protein n=1 Tax=Corynebacterium breve TaxID=3049799 RepID=A0ABY8VID9_9CORY|nr:DUF4245 domain-containing protein [Corynebacterium breve]WIM68515.1 DUF4245 domain-containing protein [Corynebacterium breve]